MLYKKVHLYINNYKSGQKFDLLGQRKQIFFSEKPFRAVVENPGIKLSSAIGRGGGQKLVQIADG